MTPALPWDGGCQCGEIRYRVTGEPLWLTICYCNECKRQSGSAFGMSLRIAEADVTLVSGTPKQWARPADSGRAVVCHFCGTCGTRVWHEPAGSGLLVVKPGTLDDPSHLAPHFEAWARRKAPWLSIAGLHASFDEQPLSGSSRTGA